MQINAAIIGLGNIGLKYDLKLSNEYVFTHAKAFDMHPAFNLIGAADASSHARREFEENFLLPTFETSKSLIANSKPNIISIATPTHTHLSILKEIIELNSLKCVLMEKPLANTFQESKEIYEICRSNDLRLFINLVRRCDPGINKLKQLILKKKFEGLFKAHVIYSKGLLHNGIHFIDIFMYLFGNIKKISTSKDFILHFSQGEVLFTESDDSYSGKNSFEIIYEKNSIKYSPSGVITILNEQPLDKNHDPQTLNLNTNSYQYHSIDSISKHSSVKQSQICMTDQWIKELKYIYKKINDFEGNIK